MKAQPASAPKARVAFTINKDDWILPSPLRLNETGMPPIWCQVSVELRMMKGFDLITEIVAHTRDGKNYAKRFRISDLIKEDIMT